MSASKPIHETEVRELIKSMLPPSESPNPPIFGPAAPLDSLGLVNLLADLEFRLGERFGCDLVLASEQAMSRSRSPYRDVDSLTEYALELMR
jgi:hypothetical protein